MCLGPCTSPTPRAHREGPQRGIDQGSGVHSPQLGSTSSRPRAGELRHGTMIRDRLQAPGWLLAAHDEVGGVGADRLMCVRARVHMCVCRSLLHVFTPSPSKRGRTPWRKQFTCRLAIFAKTQMLKDASVASVGVLAVGQPLRSGSSRPVLGCLRFLLCSQILKTC